MSRSNVVRDPEDMAKEVEEVHGEALFGDGDVVLTPLAEQHYLLAIAALDQAKAHFTLARYFLARKD